MVVEPTLEIVRAATLEVPEAQVVSIFAAVPVGRVSRLVAFVVFAPSAGTVLLGQALLKM